MERDQSDDKAYRVSKKIEVLTQAQDSQSSLIPPKRFNGMGIPFLIALIISSKPLPEG